VNSLLGRSDSAVELGSQTNNLGWAQPGALSSPRNRPQPDILTVVIDDKTLVSKRSLQVLFDGGTGRLALRGALLRARPRRFPGGGAARGIGSSLFLAAGRCCQQMLETHPGFGRRLAGNDSLGSPVPEGGT
jgi:hypothetical protein